GIRPARQDRDATNDPAYVTIGPELNVSENCRDDGKHRQHQRGAPVAQFPFLNHRTAAESKPSRLLDNTDINRRTKEAGGDSECIQTGPHGAGSRRETTGCPDQCDMNTGMVIEFNISRVTPPRMSSRSFAWP